MSTLTKLRRCCFVVFASCVATPAASQELTISTGSESGRRLFLQARDDFHMTRFAKARELFEETLEVEPELAIAHAYLALADSFTYYDPQPALAAASDPEAKATPGERMMSDALASFLDRDLEGAVSTLLELTGAFPDDPYVRHALGFTLVDLGATHDGIEVLESLLADRPDFIAAWNHLGYAYLDLGDFGQALGCLYRFVAQAPDNPSAHDSLADVLATVGRVNEAIASLTRATLVDPRYAHGYMHLGDVLAIENELAMARAAYRRAIDNDSSYGPRFSIVVWHRIAQSWLHGLDFEAAVATYRAIIDLSDRLEFAEEALAAERMLLTILLVDGDGAAAHEVLRSLDERVGELPESERSVRQISIFFYRGWLAVVEHDIDEVDRMVEILESAPSSDSDRRLASRLRGEAALADLRFEDAVTALESADTSNPVVLVRLALAYDGLDRSATAAALFNEADSCDTFDFECALARGLAQPLGWTAPGETEPFDWESMPPDSEDNAPDAIARLDRTLRRITMPLAASSARQ